VWARASFWTAVLQVEIIMTSLAIALADLDGTCSRVSKNDARVHEPVKTKRVSWRVPPEKENADSPICMAGAQPRCDVAGHTFGLYRPTLCHIMRLIRLRYTCMTTLLSGQYTVGLLCASSYVLTISFERSDLWRRYLARLLFLTPARSWWTDGRRSKLQVTEWKLFLFRPKVEVKLGKTTFGDVEEKQRPELEIRK